MCPSTDTIASTDVWTPGNRETLSSTKWANHTSVWRGHLLPVDASVSAAVNNTYDLGSSTYKWRTGYINHVSAATVTASTIKGQLAFAFSTLTSASSLTSSQYFLYVNASTAAFTITLPAAASYSGHVIDIVKEGSDLNAVTIDGNGSETIDDTATTSVNTQGESLRIKSNGVGWRSLSRYIPYIKTTYVPTLNSTTNVSDNTAKWYRVDRRIIIDGVIRYSATGTASNLTVGFPSGVTGDSTGLVATTTAQFNLNGYWKWYDNNGSTDSRFGGVEWNSSSNVVFRRPDTSDLVNSDAFAGSDVITYHIEMDIQGWKG